MSFSLQSVWERLRGLGRSKRRASQAQAAVTTQSNSHESTAGEAVVDAPSIATNGTTTHQPIASLKLVDDQPRTNLWPKKPPPPPSLIPLYRIPEEVLANIVKQLLYPRDMAARFCLARVSRLLRRHTLDSCGLYTHDLSRKTPGRAHERAETSEARGRELNYKYLVEMDLSNMVWGNVEWFCNVYKTVYKTVRVLLARDGLCEHCSLQRAARRPYGCKFVSRSWVAKGQPKRLHCSGCDDLHELREFSAAQRAMDHESRVCIARAGHLRLCSHKLITWPDIEQPLLALCHLRGGDTTETIQLAGCRHLMHRGCPHQSSASEAADTGTYPSIELLFNRRSGVAKLRLTWSAHATIAVNQDGRFESRDVREMFQRHRRTGAASMTLDPEPDIRRLHLDEMMCFGTDWCCCLSYINSSLAGHGSQGDSIQIIQVPGQGYRECLLKRKHKIWSTKGYGEVTVHDCPSNPAAERSSSSSSFDRRCVVTRYTRQIDLDRHFKVRPQISHPPGGQVSALSSPSRINPSHQWLHAVGHESYVLDGGDTNIFKVVPPACENAACRDYHKRWQPINCTGYFFERGYDRSGETSEDKNLCRFRYDIDFRPDIPSYPLT
ncbi:hypothetical protein QBC42DRAFT_321763 [Cladorrhinum samala]|uniref:F-box domain-containing protein n=1 Tax=Cladorrhinum samala TaxID=585594 RepID=A0AAV9HWA1_9PEZI|nr:hypothetical protein QBC42DRAFT_321763 [Cladorrhinum samala]